MAIEGIPIQKWPSSSSLTTGDSIIKCAISMPLIILYAVGTRDFTTSSRVMFGALTFLIKSRHRVVALYREIWDSHTTKRSNTKTRATSFRISMKEARDLRSD